jgi:tRNA pseudouridine55 synthase
VDHEPAVGAGILVLDKPGGMSSAAAVDHVKRALGVKRAGHGGTLDPLATGVLPICLDEATKVASYLLADDKEYLAELVLGTETDTLDREGAILAQRSFAHVTADAIAAALAARTGEHDQIPPMFSAIKRGGVRLYKQAREGIEVEREPRRVRIDRLELRAFAGGRVTIAIACSKGTYIRSLVADLGTDLGCGAYLAELRRTRSGVFAIEDAQPLAGLTPQTARIRPFRTVLRLPEVVAPPPLVRHVRSGVQLDIAQLAGTPPEPEQFQVIDDAGALLAIAHAVAGKVVYDRVFAA